MNETCFQIMPPTIMLPSPRPDFAMEPEEEGGYSDEPRRFDDPLAQDSDSSDSSESDSSPCAFSAAPLLAAPARFEVEPAGFGLARALPRFAGDEIVFEQGDVDVPFYVVLVRKLAG